MFVGLDMGTSIAKAAAFAEDGTALRVESKPISLGGRGDHVEQDIEEVVRAATDVLTAVTDGGAPALVALTGQGDGLWLVDAEGKAVRPALSWMDGRAGDLVAGWMGDGTAEKMYRHTGNVLFPGSPGPLLAWLDRNEPESLDAATTAAACKDILHLRLTGERGTDLSDASVPFLDPRTRAYSPQALAALGVDHRAGLLPPSPRPCRTGRRTGTPRASPPGLRSSPGRTTFPRARSARG